MYVDLALTLNKNPKAKMGNLLVSDNYNEDEIVGFIERDMTSTKREDDILNAVELVPPTAARVPLVEAKGGGLWCLYGTGEIIKVE
jgi:hypothetical protein